MLTPEDLVDYPLKVTVRGYSVAQVDELLDQAADSLEQLQQRVAQLEEQLGSCEERLADAAETEQTLKRTLVTAQRAAEQSLQEARQEAARLLEQAEQQARNRELEAERRRRQLEDHIEELRDFEESYREELRALIEERLRQLDELGPTVAPLRDQSDVPAEVADLVDVPEDDRGPLRVRVHDDRGDGGEQPAGPLAWPSSGASHGRDDAPPDADDPGE